MTSDMAMNTQVIIPDGDEEIVRVVENAVQAAHTMNADTNEFNYASASSSEEVAMLNALLRHTAANEAAGVVSMTDVGDQVANSSIMDISMTSSKNHTLLNDGTGRDEPENNATLHGSQQLQVDDLGRHCFECSGVDSINGNKLMYCTHCHRSYHQLCHDPVVDDEWLGAVTEWLCQDCIQKYGVQFTAETDQISDTTMMTHGDDERQSDTLDTGLAIGAEIAKTTNRRMEQAVSGIGISYAQKKNYLNTLPKSVLVDLVLACDATHPDMPLFPASLRSQAMSSSGMIDDYNHVGDWNSDVNGVTSMRTKTTKPRTASERSLGETGRSSRETVTGLTPRRTQGRRAPRSAEGHPLPSYEDLCVEAVLDMNKPGGSLPKRIFEWIANNYPVAPNFRPSCSQALQRAFRKGKLEKDGRAYKVSQSELMHIREYQERQRQSRAASMENTHAMMNSTDNTAELTVLGTTIDSNSCNTRETESSNQNNHTNNNYTDEHENQSVMTEENTLTTSTASMHMENYDQSITLNLDQVDIPESADALATVEQSVDILGMHNEMTLPDEATEEDTAAIVAAVTAGHESVMGDELEIEVTDPEPLMVDTGVETKNDELDVEAEVDVETDGAAAARTAPTRHRQHRQQRRGKRVRQEATTTEDLVEAESAVMEKADVNEDRPRQRRRVLSAVTVGDHVNA